MKIVLMVIVFWLCLATEIHAQQGLSIDMNKASLAWQWTQGTGGPVESFEMKCGSSPGTYTVITTVAGTSRSMPVTQAIKGSGQWYCTVVAVNKYGSSGSSNEVGFDAGATPVAPTGLMIQAQ